jgi:hypothetical protein
MATATRVQPGLHLNMAAITAALQPAINAAMKDIGTREVASIEEALSVPVERDFAGNVIERSKPGEPPRLDEDVLRGNVEWRLVGDGDDRHLVVMAARPDSDAADAAITLEYGGVSSWGYIEERPFMRPAFERMKTYYLDVFENHLRQALK